MPEYSPLPEEVVEICRAVRASPRLVAHLRLVHDVAGRLIKEIQKAFPQVTLDGDAVLFGAATHDVGKAIYFEELVGPGHKHESKGVELLREHGISEKLARFAYTHANWNDGPGLAIEDLLVAIADNCWKGKRSSKLEEKAVEVISIRAHREAWEVFAELDDILQRLAADADERLAWQAQHPA
jgi:putative nucleotidyltransferase with HDIG domain